MQDIVVPALEGKNVLIAAAPDTLELAARSLERHGLKIVAARDGEAALQQAETSPPDLILLDERLPGIDGFETCRRLKASGRTRRIPVILVISRADHARKLAVFAAGAVEYVQEPLEPEEVVGRVKTHLALEEIRSTREFLDTIIEHVPVSIVVRNVADMSYALINRACEEFYGLSREQVVGKGVYEVFPRESADIIMAQDQDLLRRGTRQFFPERLIATPANGDRIITSQRIPVFDAKGEPKYIIGVFEDVTDRRRVEQQVRHLAMHDPLTDLPNRMALNEYLGLQLAHEKESFAVMSIDLDRFKEVNDVFGHAAGDALLCETARRLRAAVGEAFLARSGGDEFVVITKSSAQPDSASELAERILAAVADDIEIEGQAVRTGLSVGVTIYPTDATEAATLLANADAALYRAKVDGRATIRFFEAEMDKRLHERRTLQRDLRGAIGRGELKLFYQPQALVDGTVIGFEALIRWFSPARGMVSPGVFIPLAEESGMISDIDQWVLREACTEAASWSEPLQISANLSPVLFRHGDLPKYVHEVLLETGLAPHRLELEITEGVLIQDLQRALSTLRRLKALGVRVAMDDFGTGYSSLNYLQSFPFDKIKIDQSFISKLESSEQSAVIVRTMIALGRGLSIPVIAEGVETKTQLAFLANEHCKEVQGYLIGRPQPIACYGELIGKPAEPLQGARAATGS